MKKIFFMVLYLGVSTTLYCLFQMKYFTQPLTFFFNDPTVQSTIQAQTTYDPHDIFQTRLYHNKVVAYVNTFAISVYQAVDPLYVFSFYDSSSLYEGQERRLVLLPTEFPLFLFAMWWIIRTWKVNNQKYRFVIPGGIFVVLFTGIFLPALHPVSLLPLVIYIRILIFLGISEYFYQKKRR